MRFRLVFLCGNLVNIHSVDVPQSLLSRWELFMPCGMILSDSWKSANRAKMVLLGTISGFQESGSIPIRSFTAPRRRCLQPRYFSVVCTDTCPSRN